MTSTLFPQAHFSDAQCPNFTGHIFYLPFKPQVFKQILIRELNAFDVMFVLDSNGNLEKVDRKQNLFWPIIYVTYSSLYNSD